MRGAILKCITVEGREKQQKVKKDRERERGGKKSEWNVESFHTKLRQNIKFQFATKKYEFRSKEGVAINAFNSAPFFSLSKTDLIASSTQVKRELPVHLLSQVSQQT